MIGKYFQVLYPNEPILSCEYNSDQKPIGGEGHVFQTLKIQVGIGRVFHSECQTVNHHYSILKNKVIERYDLYIWSVFEKKCFFGQAILKNRFLIHASLNYFQPIYPSKLDFHII